MNTMLCRSLALLIAVVVVLVISLVASADASQDTTYETATRCLFEKARLRPESQFNIDRLTPQRRQLFDNLVALAISEHAAKNPHWFIGKKKKHTSDDYCALHLVAVGKPRSKETPPNAAGECLLFLAQFAPEQDLKLPLGFFLETVVYTLKARDAFPFAADIPWHLVLNEVLPYSVLSEPREMWRRQFFDYFNNNFGKQLRNITSGTAAAEWMNANAYNMKTPRIFYYDCVPDYVCGYAPLEVLKRGNASCTGLSIFLISASRSVGLPARIAGTPHWNLGPKKCPDGDASPDCGNHDWTETGAHSNSWSFQDSDGIVRLNHSWFVPGWSEHQVPRVGNFVNHSIFASSWAPSAFVVHEWGGDADPLAEPFEYFPMVWNWTGAQAKITSAWSVTRRYLLFDPKK